MAIMILCKKWIYTMVGIVFMKKNIYCSLIGFFKNHKIPYYYLVAHQIFSVIRITRS
jgi:hypothetical protein